MDNVDQSEPRQVQQTKADYDPFPTQVTACHNQENEARCRCRHCYVWRDSQLAQSKRNCRKLGDQSQEIRQQQVHKRKSAPPLSESLVDHGSVTFSGSDAKPHDHLLHEIGNRQEKEHQPQQPCAVLRSRLNIRRDCAGVVVRFHDDEPWPEHHQKREQVALPLASNQQTIGRDGMCCDPLLDEEIFRTVHDSRPPSERTAQFKRSAVRDCLDSRSHWASIAGASKWSYSSGYSTRPEANVGNNRKGSRRTDTPSACP